MNRETGQRPNPNMMFDPAALDPKVKHVRVAMTVDDVLSALCTVNGMFTPAEKFNVYITAIAYAMAKDDVDPAGLAQAVKLFTLTMPQVARAFQKRKATEMEHAAELFKANAAGAPPPASDQ